MPTKTKPVPQTVPVVLPELLTIKDVAAALRVPVGTIYQWRARGSASPKAFYIGRSLRFRASDVADFITQQEREATA